MGYLFDYIVDSLLLDLEYDIVVLLSIFVEDVPDRSKSWHDEIRLC